MTGNVILPQSKFDNDLLLFLNKITDIVRWSGGKIRIKVREKTACVIDFGVDILAVDIVDPTILDLTELTNTQSGLFEMLRTAGKVGQILNDKGLSITILRKGKKALSIGRDATPTISSFITGSDDIQIDSITEAANLSRDIKKPHKR